MTPEPAPEPAPVYHITDYTCLSCGSAFSLGTWTPPGPRTPAPLLTCPHCKQTAVRTDPAEQRTIGEYLRTRKTVSTLLSDRNDEHQRRTRHP